MKLRNKKTGITGYIEYVMRTIDPTTGDPLLTVRYKDDSGITCYSDYKTVVEFNENWEDAAEPLIKDDKIRKAVRAWAESNGVTSIVVFDCDNGAYLKINEMEFAENGGRASISFNTSEKIDTSKAYTIKELCGEDEQ